MAYMYYRKSRQQEGQAQVLIAALKNFQMKINNGIIVENIWSPTVTYFHRCHGLYALYN